VGSFGNGAQDRTSWTTNDIWLRRSFEWQRRPDVQTLVLRVRQDDVSELFLNGEQVFSRPEHTAGAYVGFVLDPKALSLLKPGENTLAVHCHSTVGLQYIDVGLHGVTSSPTVTAYRLGAMKIDNPWEKLAAAYYSVGDQSRRCEGRRAALSR
jgi:hypothetical protein